jgi:2-polyprenyl-3-methyl-5-hydroxy-6-metoxy-1,4-benzoquinol methylase
MAQTGSITADVRLPAEDTGWWCNSDGQRRGPGAGLFQERYRNTPSLLAGQIEQRVIGGDWGANGFTTMVQADTLARELGLSAADRLLDLGTGRGWPGLCLAAKTGCWIVLADLPLEGLRVAASRATAEGLAARTGVVAAAASGLPFRAGSFDAVIHTDVLC